TVTQVFDLQHGVEGRQVRQDLFQVALHCWKTRRHTHQQKDKDYDLEQRQIKMSERRVDKYGQDDAATRLKKHPTKRAQPNKAGEVGAHAPQRRREIGKKTRLGVEALRDLPPGKELGDRSVLLLAI